MKEAKEERKLMDSTGLATECMKGLQLLEGKDDFELTARCRAAFSPEACKQARQSLGAQPWTSARMEQSCARFGSALQGTDERARESSLVDKPHSQMPASPQKLDWSTEKKKGPVAAPTMPEPPKQAQGPAAGLLNKLKEHTHKEDGKQKPQ